MMTVAPSVSYSRVPSLVLLGHVGYDIIFVDGIEKARCIAGSAYYAAVGAQCVSPNIGIVTRIPQVESILYDGIVGLNIPLDGVVESSLPPPEFRNYYTSSDANSASPSITYEMYMGCAEEVCFGDIPERYKKSAVIHICTAPPEQQLRWIQDIRRYIDDKIIVSMDTVTPFIVSDRQTVLRVIELSDIVFVNKEEDELLNQYIPDDKIYVKKMGKDGAELWINNKFRKRVVAPSVIFADATGAGDVLAGSFLALYSTGSTYDQALEGAVNIASSSVNKYGVDHLIRHT